VIKNFLTETASLRKPKSVPAHAIKIKARGWGGVNIAVQFPYIRINGGDISIHTAVPTVHESGWMSEAVWMFRRRGKSIAPTGNQNFGHLPFKQLAVLTVVSPLILYANKVYSCECPIKEDLPN
jgi:hypothetical protein